MATKIGPMLFPDEYNIKIWREDGEYVMEYEERVKKPDDMPEEMFQDTIRATIALAKSLAPGVDFKYDSDSSTVSVRLTIRELSKIATFLVSEFLPVSIAGKVTLGELIAYSLGIGMSTGVVMVEEHKE